MLVFAKKYFFNKMRIFFIGEISPALAIFLLFRPTSNDKYRQCRRNVEEFSAEFEFLDFGICREKDQDMTYAHDTFPHFRDVGRFAKIRGFAKLSFSHIWPISAIFSGVLHENWPNIPPISPIFSRMSTFSTFFSTQKKQKCAVDSKDILGVMFSAEGSRIG